jgi:hypothetical protein
MHLVGFLVATVSYEGFFFLSNQEAPLSSADQKESNGTISQARALKIGFAPKFMMIFIPLKISICGVRPVCT